MNPSMIAMSEAINKVQLKESEKLDQKIKFCLSGKLPVEGTSTIPINLMLIIYYETKGKDLIIDSLVDLLLTGIADEPETEMELKYKEVLSNIKKLFQRNITVSLYQNEVKEIEDHLNKRKPNWYK